MTASRNVLFVDIERCVGCHSCELACAIEHSKSKQLFSSPFEKPRSIPRIRIVPAAGYVVPLPCMHCETAACAVVCPTDALTKETETGIVKFSEELCIGCSACVMACPFGVITMDWARKVSSKCDLCPERRTMGLPPACVEACPTESIRYGPQEDLLREVRARRSEEMVTGRGVAAKGVVILRKPSTGSE